MRRSGTATPGTPAGGEKYQACAPPARDLAAAHRGADLFSQHCAKCHGPEAVAVRSVLAPVDLLISVSRFSYIGFSYIVLNGRSQRGMPGFRGSLEPEQTGLIYQYARERSHGTIQASAEAHALAAVANQ